MPVNDFKAFATGEFANVLSQPEFEELEALGNGFQAGIARSEELNKVWRQASTIASVVASFMATKSGNDVLDNGDVTTLQATLLKALLNNSTSQLDGRYLKAASNLSELSNAASARGNLGLKGAAVQDVGTTSGTVAAGNDTRIVNALQKGNNLSEIKLSGGNAQEAARTNLGLGTAATANVQVSATDTTPGRLMPVGAFGLGGTVTNAADDKITNFYYGAVGSSFNPTTDRGYVHMNIAASAAYRARLAIDYSAQNAPRVFFQNMLENSYSSWVQFYTTAFKPTAQDVGALPISGGVLSGPLRVNSDGGSVMLKPKTPGSGSYIISQDSAGVNNWYLGYGSVNNNTLSLTNYKTLAAIHIGDDIRIGKPVYVTGTINPTV